MSHDERLLELISALVDGELTPDERSRAEQLLAANAGLRVYHDELLAMRASVQGLPRFKLPASFSEKVLRRAEREMLLATSSAAVSTNGQSALVQPAVSGKTHSPTKAPGALQTSSALRRWSPWLAAAASVAAVIAIILVIQNQQPRIADKDAEKGGTNVAQNIDQQSLPDQQIRDQQSALVENTTRNGAAAPEETIEGNSGTLPEESSNAELANNNSHDNSSPESAGPPDTDLAQNNTIITDNAGSPSTVNAGPNLQIPMYAFMYEVVLTRRGIEEDVFEKALQSSQIHLQSVIPLDRGMERTLLSHKYFGGVRPEDLPADDGAPRDADPLKDHLELFFLACNGVQLDELGEFLIGQIGTGTVIAVKHDMASAMSDMELYSRMQKLVQDAPDSEDNYVGAHPLVMEAELRERLMQALRHSKGLPDPVPGAVLPGNVPQEQNGELEQLPKEIVEEMRKQISLVIVVLRSADTVE